MATPVPGVFTASLPEYYEYYLVGPLFRPFAELLLERIAVRRGDRILDVACGTGIVARLAADTVGAGGVIGLDASANMLAMASRVAPAVEWREGNATALPFGDAAFDVVTCHQGLQFFPDRAAAVREMRRVLKPHGRVAVAAWLALDEVPALQAAHRVVERHLGPVVDHRHAFGDAAVLGSLLNDAGFQQVAIERVTKTIRVQDAALFARMNTMAVVGMSAKAKAMSETERAAVAATIAAGSLEAWRPHINGTDIVFELATNLATARA